MKLLVTVAVTIVLIAAVALAVSSGRGNSDEANDPRAFDEPGPARVEPGDIVETPERWYREPVVVRGRVSATGAERRFALRGPEGAVLVQPEPGVPVPERGDTVEVVGTVNYVSRVAADDIGEIGRAPAEQGAPYVSAGSVRPQ